MRGVSPSRRHLLRRRIARWPAGGCAGGWSDTTPARRAAIPGRGYTGSARTRVPTTSTKLASAPRLADCRYRDRGLHCALVRRQHAGCGTGHDAGHGRCGCGESPSPIWAVHLGQEPIHLDLTSLGRQPRPPRGGGNALICPACPQESERSIALSTAGARIASFVRGTRCEDLPLLR